MFLQLILLLNRSVVDGSPDYAANSGPESRGYERLFDEQRIIRNLLEGGVDTYDWRVRPQGTLNPVSENQPVDVTVNMYLRSISKVDDVNMEYSMHFTFREEWIDERLLFYSDSLSHIILSPGQKIWQPDTFFQNEKDGKRHDIDQPNILIRVHNGTAKILYSCRLTLTLSCPMVLNDYPLDVQTCFIDYASYAYTTEDIIYHWKKDNPIQIKPGLHQSLPSFMLSKVKTDNCTSVTNTGTYSCLRTVIELKREFSYYLLQLYIPSFMLVAVSWVSFWLDKDSVPARVTLGVTTLLTMTTQASAVNQNLPPVSYTKAIDIWIGVCLAFIFGALLEFALVNWAARKDVVRQSYRHRQQRAQLLVGLNNYQSTSTTAVPQIYRNGNANTSYQNSLVISNNAVTLPQLNGMCHGEVYQPKTKTWWSTLWSVRYRERSRRIDLISRILFPVCFMVFNINYWLLYLRPYMAVQTTLN
uniref:Ig-like domain-containing protein n=1 Tax=Panagrellus redivivus TaxID=6233 RepID=A0A7E4WBX2_PANRE